MALACDDAGTVGGAGCDAIDGGIKPAGGINPDGGINPSGAGTDEPGPLKV